MTPAPPRVTVLSVEPNASITFRVAHEDDDLVVVEKPPGVPTQPGKGHSSDTLLNGLFARWGPALQNLGAARDFGLLHRLDKEASGLLIVGLRPRAYDSLRQQFEGRTVEKYYWAVCSKAPKNTSGVIKLPIAEAPGVGRGGREGMRDRPKTAHVSKMGKPAVTAYRVLDSSDLGALIEARPVTGRLHQVRVHLDAIGCPILGDDFYGPKGYAGASARLALHAHRLVFTHPSTGARIDVRTGWPGDLRRLLTRLGLKRPDLKVTEAGGEGATNQRDAGPVRAPQA